MRREIEKANERHAVYVALDRFYAKIPKIKCQKLCANSCGPIDMSHAERNRIRESTGVEIEPFTEERSRRWANNEPLHCNALNRQSLLCDAYKIRPAICRLWGVTESMPCPHSCPIEANHKPLTDDQTFALLLESFEIGGHDAEAMLPHFQAIMDDPAVKPLYARFLRGDRSVEMPLIEAITAARERLGV